MAFLTYSVEHGRVPAKEYLPCSAITPKIGMALTQSDGLLAIASGTTKPTYICQEDYDSAVASGTIVGVIRADADIIFETAFSASASSIKLGNKVTLASDGLRVTATTSSGVAEVVYMDGTSSGDMCRVRFA